MAIFNHLRVKTKILVGYIITLLLLAIVGGVAIIKSEPMAQTLQQFVAQFKLKECNGEVPEEIISATKIINWTDLSNQEDLVPATTTHHNGHNLTQYSLFKEM